MLKDNTVMEAAQQSLLVTPGKPSRLKLQMSDGSDPTKAPTIFPMLFNFSNLKSRKARTLRVVTALGMPELSKAELI